MSDLAAQAEIARLLEEKVLKPSPGVGPLMDHLQSLRVVLRERFLEVLISASISLVCCYINDEEARLPPNVRVKHASMFLEAILGTMPVQYHSQTKALTDMVTRTVLSMTVMPLLHNFPLAQGLLDILNARVTPAATAMRGARATDTAPPQPWIGRRIPPSGPPTPESDDGEVAGFPLGAMMGTTGVDRSGSIVSAKAPAPSVTTFRANLARERMLREKAEETRQELEEEIEVMRRMLEAANTANTTGTARIAELQMQLEAGGAKIADLEARLRARTEAPRVDPAAMVAEIQDEMTRIRVECDRKVQEAHAVIASAKRDAEQKFQLQLKGRDDTIAALRQEITALQKQLSENLATAGTGGDATNVANGALRAHADDLLAKGNALREEIATLKANLSASKAELEASEQKVRHVTAELNAMRVTAATATGELNTSINAEQKVRGDLDAASTTIEDLRRQLAEAMATIASLEQVDHTAPAGDSADGAPSAAEMDALLQSIRSQPCIPLPCDPTEVAARVESARIRALAAAPRQNEGAKRDKDTRDREDHPTRDNFPSHNPRRLQFRKVNEPSRLAGDVITIE